MTPADAELADELFALSTRLKRAAARKRRTATTADECTAVEQLEHAAAAAFSAQAWLLRSRGVGS